MKKVYALVTARKNSKTVKNKNILKIGRDTLIGRSIKTLKKSKIFDEIFLSSDSNLYLKIGEKSKIKTIIRPKKFSLDNTPSAQVVEHFLNFLTKSNYETPKIIFIVQPTSPFVTKENYKSALNLFSNKKAASVISVIKTPHKYHYENQRTLDNENKIKFKFKNTASLRQMKEETFVHGNIFAVRTKKFLQQKKILAKPIYAFKLKKNWHAIDIDEYEDLELSRLIFKKNSKI